jgi:hypothetical protein
LKRVAALAAVGLLAAGCGATKTVTVTTNAAVKAGVGAPQEQVLFGHIASLRRDGKRFLMQFDPALLLTGVSANVAAAGDQGVSCKPQACPPVPNDNYVVDEGHRLFTYVVPASARVTVLAKSPTGTPVSVAQLAGIVSGGTLRGHPLWEGIDTGFWIRVRIDTVRTIDQQYHP